MSNDHNIVDVENVSKRYCRNLKRSMWYGLGDLAREFSGGRHDQRAQLRRGEFYSLQDISFHVKPGECVALLGPNGAGKSTMMKLLNGLLKPNSGRIQIRGKTGALIELGAGFNPVLSGRENVYINGSVLGLSRRQIDERFEEILAFSEIGDFIEAPVRTYSTGMRVRLGYSVAANLRPNLLLLDEVLAVGDVGFRMKCFNHLAQLRDQGAAIVLVSHAMAAISRVATRAVVFGKGRKVFDGDLDAGIVKYQELVGLQKTSKTQVEETKSGAAIIDSARCFSERKPESNDLETGDTLIVRVKVKAIRPIKNARLILNLVSPQSGALASLPSLAGQLELDLSEAVHEIEVRFPNIPLLLGHYFFNIGLYGAENVDFHDRKMSATSFNVVGPYQGEPGFGMTGLLKLEQYWSVVKNQ